MQYVSDIIVDSSAVSIAIYPFLMLTWNFTILCLVVSSIGECVRLSQPSWLLGTL